MRKILILLASMATVVLALIACDLREGGRRADTVKLQDVANGDARFWLLQGPPGNRYLSCTMHYDFNLPLSGIFSYISLRAVTLYAESAGCAEQTSIHPVLSPLSLRTNALDTDEGNSQALKRFPLVFPLADLLLQLGEAIVTDHALRVPLVPYKRTRLALCNCNGEAQLFLQIDQELVNADLMARPFEQAAADVLSFLEAPEDRLRLLYLRLRRPAGEAASSNQRLNMSTRQRIESP